MALNLISPFTTQSTAYREGLIATLLYNNNIGKKEHLKSVGDLFPYLEDGVPEYLEDERVIKAKNLLESIKVQSLVQETYTKNYKFISNKIREEIEIEERKTRPDYYLINKLKELIKED